MWRVRTDLVECFLRDPAQVDVVVARSSHFHLRSWTPPLHTHRKSSQRFSCCLRLYMLLENHSAADLSRFQSFWKLLVILVIVLTISSVTLNRRQHEFKTELMSILTHLYLSGLQQLVQADDDQQPEA